MQSLLFIQDNFFVFIQGNLFYKLNAVNFKVVSAKYFIYLMKSFLLIQRNLPLFVCFG